MKKKYMHEVRKELKTIWIKGIYLYKLTKKVDLLFDIGEYFKRVYEKSNARLTGPEKLFVCKKCGTLIIPGITGFYRIHSTKKNSYISIRCARCGYVRRLKIKDG